MIGTPGWRARRAETMRRVGAMTCRPNSSGDSTPDQLSNSISASAPASAWAERYSTVLSASRSMSAVNSAGSPCAMPRTPAKSLEPPPSTM